MPEQTHGARARASGRLRRISDRAGERRRAARQLAGLLSRAGRGAVASTILAHLVAGSMPIVFLVCLGRALQLLVSESGSIAVWWLAAGLSAFLLQQLLAPVQLLLSEMIARQVDRYCLRRFTGFALTRAPLRTLERPAVADRLSQANEAFEQMALTPGAAAEGALALIARYTQLAGAVVVVAVTAGPWAALGAAFVAVVTRRGQSAAFNRWGKHVRLAAPARRRTAYVRDLATSTRAAKEIRTLGLIDWIDDRYAAESRGHLEPLWRSRRAVYGRPFVVYTLLGLAGTAAALLAVAGLGAGGTASVGPLAMAVQGVVLCARFGVMFSESDTKMVYGRNAWEALLEFERVCLAATAGERRRRTTAENVPDLAALRSRTITFDGVSFSYDGRRPVLRDLGFQLSAGTSTALVGVNGAGKTTLVKVLTGLYRPDEGRVLVGGTDLVDLPPEAWRRQFAVTFQDFVRYELTIRENVAMSAITHLDDDAGILAELSRAGLGELVASSPSGLDTPLTRATADGRELSGGQWQRLALARSLFAVRHGASVLVLDEPTAQLDARGEAEFYDMFLELTRGVTSMIISHRFSSVRRADRIVVLDGGSVAECGGHDDLVAAGGEYARLFSAQASRFARAGGKA
ncbi:ABC transporter ATP-binding protein [Lentzea sp. BCCO 10_0798]|uniref:ABC transporter ATP-binding protein n=1 Tax=Lentzea kristufekii TaxID=3095430 RepID=A0ABU4TRK4_9PSEU|nr:ABC transporter ATP-binding protein [Lentzea sp. BCCO 10_0798]MDX8050919.1 ABC transporter ATP-binding protein [Lentzea sp. BCCO 10_0798]